MATFIVNSANDLSNPFDLNLTLREAIELANLLPGTDEIVFAPFLEAETILLNGFAPGNDLDITDDLIIDGDLDNDNRPDIRINGQNLSRVFDVADGVNVTFDGLLVTGGGVLGDGAAIRGGVGSDITVVSSELLGNVAAGDGGAIYTEGTLNVERSTIANNFAGSDGGGIYADDTEAVIANSVLFDNVATGEGGGLYNNLGFAAVVNSSVVNNQADQGGGIYNTNGDVTLVQATVTGNEANTVGGGIANTTVSDVLRVANSIVAGNSAGVSSDDVAGPINFRFGTNIYSQAGLGTVDDILATDLTDVFAQLDGITGGGLLTYNGGFVNSVALNPLGIAVDAGINTFAVDPGPDFVPQGFDTALVTDTRGFGFDRIVNGQGPNRVDVGAFEVQNNAPTITINTGISVLEGDEEVIDNLELRAIDADDVPGNRIFTLVEAPENGVLELFGLALDVGDTFTQAHINNLNVSYQHDDSETETDSFLFNVTDPSGVGVFNQLFEITVIPELDEPELTRNTGFVVQEGQEVVISEFNLFGIDSEDQPNELRFEIDSVPMDGVLRRGGAELGMGESFTVEDVQLGIITYEHDGSEADPSDSFVLSLIDSDGLEPLGLPSFVVNVGVVEVSDAPFLVTSNGINVIEDDDPGGTIDGADLDFDDDDSPDSQIVYTIINGTDVGTLTRDGAVLTAGQTFTQQDIEDGLIEFSSTDEEGTSDSFDYIVANPGGPGTFGTFFFSITPVDDAPEYTSFLTFGVMEGTAGVITNEFLNIEDPDTDPSKLRYEVTGAGPEEGVLARLGVQLNAGDSFTQADVDSGFITYSHDGSEDPDDFFRFTISDETTDDGTVYTLPIAIALKNDLPVLVNNFEVLVEEYQEDLLGNPITSPYPIAITSSHLLATDDDLDDDPVDIVYTITENTAYGTLFRTDSGLDDPLTDGIPLKVGSTFTQEDVDNGYLFYANDGSEFFQDGFSYKISNPGEPDFITGLTEIVIQPVNDVPYIALNEGAHTIEGGEIVISSLKLFTTDADHPPSDLVYIICDLPHHGMILKDGKPLAAHKPGHPLNSFTTFTQADIDAGKITYKHDGSEEWDFDNFTFVVADGDWAYAPYDPHKFEKDPLYQDLIIDWYDVYGDWPWWDWLNLDYDDIVTDYYDDYETPPIHKFKIKISPDNDGATLEINNGIEVNEGGSATFNALDLLAIDGDSQSGNDDIFFFLKELPENGSLFLDGVKLKVGDSFTQTDINAGNVQYIHDDSNGDSDVFFVDVLDEEGEGITNQPVFVAVNGTNDAPVMIANTGIKLGQDEIEIINPSELAAFDPDNTAAELTYTLTKLPENGTVKRGTIPLELGDKFTQSDINAGLIGYDHNGSNTEADSFRVNLKDPAGTGPTTQTIAVQIVPDAGPVFNDLPIAVDDAFETGKNTPVIANVLADNGNGADFDPDGTFLSVAEVEGNAALVGTQILLPSGALLSIQANGELYYDPDGKFDFLLDGQKTTDSFNYTVSDGEGGFDDAEVVVELVGGKPPVADGIPIVSIAPEDSVKAEGNSGTTITTFKVTRTGDTTVPVLVNYITTGISPFPASALDFAGNKLPAGTITFAAGQTEALIALPIDGDFAFEEDENFQVRLVNASAPNGVAIDQDTAQGTIINDDLVATVVLSAGKDKDKGSTDVDIMEGMAGKDSLSGDMGNDIIFGGDGGDKIKGEEGNDALFGEAGDDKLDGGDGDDEVDGGAGDDKMKGGDGNDTIFGDTGDDNIKAGDGNDTVAGGDGNDRIRGDDGNDEISGGAGADDLRGGDGNDSLSGGEGNDDLDGGKGMDWLFGGAGLDELKGGKDADTFAFGPGSDTDVVTDFDADEDRLDLTAWAASDQGADFDTAAEIKALAVQSGKDVRIEFSDSDVLILEKTDLADIQAMNADQFDFV